MFSNAIRSGTKFLDNTSINYFADTYQISVDNFGGDHSFAATVMALMPRRLRGDGFIVSYGGISCIEQLENRDQEYVDGLIRRYMDRVAYRNSEITVYYFNSSIYGAFTAFKNNFIRLYPEYKELENIEEYFSRITDTLIAINEEKKSAIVLVEQNTIEFIHLLQSALPRLVPEYFTSPEDALTTRERDFLRTLSRKDGKNDYLSFLKEFEADYDFRGIKTRALLAGFESKVYRNKLSNVEQEIRYLDQNIQDNLSQYSRLINSRAELYTKKYGLEYQCEHSNDSEDFVEYCASNKRIEVVWCGNDAIEFIVNCHLENFDPDIYESYAGNLGSYIYNHFDYERECFYDDNNRKKFLDAIFGDDPQLKIRCCAFYRIYMDGDVGTERHYDFGDKYIDYIPNPHLDYHECLGDYNRTIKQALLDGDYMLAVEQCIASAKSINIGESVTFPKLLATLLGDVDDKYIELPDGTPVTSLEAYQWLLAQEENNAEEKKEEHHG